MNRTICIHGHFYQPPRENPWLEEVELQDSAYPYHDWNEKIAAQCYAPNAASRILDSDHRIVQIVNNYSKMSFNFGPSLLSWMERHRPDTYKAILEADRVSRERFSGHGSALAQVYNHMIMPLANKRDKYTQVLWGLADFRRRFDRDPEGMWLSETAVDVETLEILAAEGIRFTILAPRQARRVRKMSRGAVWKDVSDGRVTPSMPYLFQLPSGKTINLFFYDGPISQEIAFGGLLENGEAFARRLMEGYAEDGPWPQIVHVAVDGETFGHHQRHGDMALAYCLHFIESQALARLTNYGEFLEEHPPTHFVDIWENSSWSCIHGIERWREDCGCHSGMHPGWSQAWRKPLREALDWLRDEVGLIYEEYASQYLRSPWEVRNAYIEVVLNRDHANMVRFLDAHALTSLTPEARVTVLQLLEMQRNAMLMYTSCGWFFDELSGIESVQVLQYAAKVVQYAEWISERTLEAEFVRRLEMAPSNLFENGANVYAMFVKSAQLDLLRVGVHYAVSSLFQEYSENAGVYCYTVQRLRHDVYEAGKLRLAMGQARVLSNITLDDQKLTYAVLHLGDHNLNGGVRAFLGDDTFESMSTEIRSAFDKADVPEIIRLMDRHFENNNYSLWHLFRDEQRKVIEQILQLTYNEVEASYRNIYENCHAIMNFLQGLSVPLPKFILVAAERIINLDLQRLFETEEINLEKLESLIHVAKRWQVEINREVLSFKAGAWVDRAMEGLQAGPTEERAATIGGVLRLLGSLEVPLDLWVAQNILFFMGEAAYREDGDGEEGGQPTGDPLTRGLEELAHQLNVTLT